MKKTRNFKRLCGCCLAVSACTLLVAAATSSAATDMTDMTSMMAEGIPYECAETSKCIAGSNDNRADTEALMAEGIVYTDSVIADDTVLIKLDHRDALLQSMEACLCEGIHVSVAAK